LDDLVNVHAFARDENEFAISVWTVTATYWEPIDLGESDCLIKTKQRDRL